MEGAIPEWLEGDLYRTGPGITRGYTHYFDGLAMLVNFRFAGGRVSWQQRFVESEDYAQYRRTGTPQFPAFGFNPGPLQSIRKAMINRLGLGIGTPCPPAALPQPQTCKDSVLTYALPLERTVSRHRRSTLTYTHKGSTRSPSHPTVRPARCRVAQLMPKPPQQCICMQV